MVTYRAGRPGYAWVTFILPAAIWADQVSLVGDFNGWSPSAMPLRHEEHGWTITLELPMGRTYHYSLLLGGWDQEVPRDPIALRKSLSVQQLHLPAADALPLKMPPSRPAMMVATSEFAARRAGP